MSKLDNLSTSAAAGYGGTALTLDDEIILHIARAFVMQPSDIVAALTSDFNNVGSSSVKFLAVKADGTLDDSYRSKKADDYYSANGFGFWFDASGAVNTWSNSYTYLEYDPTSWTCQFGVHPNKVADGSIKVGDTYPVAVAFVHGDYAATLRFNISITE